MRFTVPSRKKEYGNPSLGSLWGGGLIWKLNRAKSKTEAIKSSDYCLMIMEIGPYAWKPDTSTNE